MPRRKILRLFVLWFALVCVCAGIAMAFFRPLVYWRFASTGVETKAMVTDKEPENHGLIHYSYAVGGQEYYAVGHAGYGNPDFRSIAIGQELIAFYDSSEPSRSILGNPREQLKSTCRF